MEANDARPPGDLRAHVDERAQLRRDLRVWRTRQITALDERDKALTEEFSRALGVDVLELAARVAKRSDGQFAALKAERDELVGRASDLAGRTGAAHDAAVRWGVRHGGVAPLLHRYLHNPSLTSKVCFDWDAWTAGEGIRIDDFEVHDGGTDPAGRPLPDFVTGVRPHARSDVGAAYWGHEFTCVSQTLRYRPPTPGASALVDGVSVLLDMHGVLSAYSGDFFSFSMSRAMAAGGGAGVDLTIHVSQEVTRPDGDELETLFEVVAPDVLVRCEDHGGIHLIGRLGDDVPEVREIAGNTWRLEYPTAFPVYGSAPAAGEPRGGQITVSLEFLTWADADYYHAEADATFHGPGQGIHVREVVLHVS